MGLSIENILEFNIGLTIGLLNEKSNQMFKANKENSEEEKVIQGNAEMLMRM